MSESYTYMEEDDESLKRTLFGKTIPHFGWMAYLGEETYTDDIEDIYGEGRLWIIPPGELLHLAANTAEDAAALYGESGISVVAA